MGAATGCLAARAPAAAAAPGGPGGAPTVLAALLTAAPAGTLAGLAGAGAGRAIAKRDGAPAGDAVRLAAAALMAGAALAPLGATTPLVSAAAALLLLKGALRDPEGSRLGATAALAALAPVVHFAATMPGVTADHLRYGLEAPTLLGSPEAWGLRPAWSAESQDLARTASWSAWWATMRQAAAEAATTDVVLSPASIFAAAAGAAAAAHGRAVGDSRTRLATWAWIVSGIGAAGLGTAGGWTGLLGRASSWLQRAGWAAAILRKLVDEEDAGRGDAVETAAAKVSDAGAADTSADASYARSIPRRIRQLAALDPEAAAARDWKGEGKRSPRATLAALSEAIKAAEKKKPGGTNGSAGPPKNGGTNSRKGGQRRR